MKNTRIALIPAYDPDEWLLRLLEEVRERGFEAVVVNDGSSEETAGLFRRASEYGAVLCHSENRGKGRALKTGMAYIQAHFNEDYVVVTMDADGQHRVSDAERLYRIACEHPGSLVLGSRKMKENVPARSRFGNTVTRFVYGILAGQTVYDTQTGLRAFGSGLVPGFLEISGERYEYEMNVLLACSRKGIPIIEAEVETIYMDGNASSHFDTIRDSFRIYKEILKFSASSFAGFLVDYALYSVLTLATAGLGSVSLVVSNVGARVVSAGVNYTLNRRLVFRSETGVARSAAQYFALAAAILAGNTLVLQFLAEGLGINRYVAKLCTELMFFVVSWLVQRRFIFKKRGGN